MLTNSIEIVDGELSSNNLIISELCIDNIELLLYDLYTKGIYISNDVTESINNLRYMLDAYKLSDNTVLYDFILYIRYNGTIYYVVYGDITSGDITFGDVTLNTMTIHTMTITPIASIYDMTLILPYIIETLIHLSKSHLCNTLIILDNTDHTLTKYGFIELDGNMVLT
jgi:hypothetical protein